ncbi:MAG: DEAD/DEAH box helicase, partial [Microthrixaceae bacterium]
MSNDGDAPSDATRHGVKPHLSTLLGRLAGEPSLSSLLGRSQTAIAVAEPARAPVLAGIAEMSTRCPVVVAVPLASEAERLAADVSEFLGDSAVELFPAWETLPFERVSPGVETMGRRMEVLWRLRTGDETLRVVVAPARALVQRLGPHVEDTEPVIVAQGDVIDPTALVEELVESGYRREYQVEHRGEVAVRGSIVDVFPATADQPVRIDLWGDEVDRLTRFSVADQLATEAVAEVRIFPARELLVTDEIRSRAEELISAEPWGREQWQRISDGETFDGMEAWLPWLTDDEHVLYDLVGDDSLIVAIEPRRLRDRAMDIRDEEVSLAGSLSRTWGLSEGADVPRLHVEIDRLLAHTDAATWSMSTVASSPEMVAVDARSWPPAIGDAAAVTNDLRALLAESFTIVLCAQGEGAASRLIRALGAEGLEFTALDPGAPIPDQPGGFVVASGLDRGAILHEIKIALLSEADLTGRRRTHRPARAPRRDAQTFFEDLGVGDHVVHEHHGVARFGGMVTRSMGGAERDYLLLEYKGDDRLYVPSDQIESVRLYSGGETPALNKMGGADFARTKAKVRSAVSEIAQELVVLYQSRMSAQGHAYGEDTPWQREMEAAFPYQETPDQLTAIADVKADMASESPMDRLVCGDVGFGKTEVALRAAFKAVQAGKQVAVLVPTTLLAQQHHQTFSDRYEGFPVRVEVLSRFLTPAQARKVTNGLADGEVDVVIGTHKLLSDDVKFKDLGLLVVDEEQRFGVSHKEAIKALRTDVD